MSPTFVIEEEAVARYRCLGDDRFPFVVIEFQHFATVQTPAGIRRQHGARRLTLGTGEGVRYIDARAFEVVPTGELLRRAD